MGQAGSHSSGSSSRGLLTALRSLHSSHLSSCYSSIRSCFTGCSLSGYNDNCTDRIQPTHVYCFISALTSCLTLVLLLIIVLGLTASNDFTSTTMLVLVLMFSAVSLVFCYLARCYRCKDFQAITIVDSTELLVLHVPSPQPEVSIVNNLEEQPQFPSTDYTFANQIYGKCEV
ncbi:hypothetical protein RCL1_005850 [Eukaryota sp. TZLM3-RCL]